MQQIQIAFGRILMQILRLSDQYFRASIWFPFEINFTRNRVKSISHLNAMQYNILNKILTIATR